MTRSTTKRLTTGAVALSLLLGGSAALAGQGFRGGREGAPGRGLRAAGDQGLLHSRAGGKAARAR